METISNHTVFTKDLITNEQYTIIMESGSIAWSVFSILGLVSNIINIRTFIALGLSDGVTVSFLFLSLFDLSFLMMAFCFGVTTGISIIEMETTVRFQIEPYGLFMFFGSFMFLLNVTNTLATTYIAVARCMCVAKPLHFKNTFSRNKTVAFNIGFAAFASAIYVPILAHMGMLPKKDKQTNITRPSLWVSKDREAIKDVVWVLINTVLPLLTEVIIMVCVFVMVSSLRTAARFRRASTLSSAKTLSTKIENAQSENLQSSALTVPDRPKGKEQRVVQQVILISSVYIICNTAKIIITIVGLIEPQFSTIGLYKKLYVSVHSLQKYLEIGNASVNTFIYYSYNTKFRTSLRRLISE